MSPVEGLTSQTQGLKADVFSVTAIQGWSIRRRMKNMLLNEDDRLALILPSHKSFLEKSPCF